jgi:hypothetical protein
VHRNLLPAYGAMLDTPHKWVFLAGFAVYVGIRHIYAKRVTGQDSTITQLDGR